MRRRGSIGLALAAGSLSGAVSAAPLPATPALAQVEALCPGIAGNPVRFGMDRTAAETPLKQAGAAARAAGFEDRIAVYTSWSQHLAAVDYVLDVPSGEPLGEWRAPLDSALVAAGWEATDDTSTGFAAPGYRKRVETADGPRTLAIEIDIYGERRGITLRCGDADLLDRDAGERDGILADGSPRPVRDGETQSVEAFLARFDCTDPALLALFAHAADTDDVGAIVEARLGPSPDLFAEQEYQQRMVTWLKWKLMRSGRVDDDGLWAIQERVAALDPRDHEAELVGFLGAFGKVIDADKRGDTAAHCRSFRDTLEILARQSVADARRDAALAAAYEAEAARLGIALD